MYMPVYIYCDVDLFDMVPVCTSGFMVAIYNVDPGI